MEKLDKAIDKAGGRFKLTVLMQKRLVELRRGAPPLVAAEEDQNDSEIILEEILQEKVQLKDYTAKGEKT